MNQSQKRLILAAYLILGVQCEALVQPLCWGAKPQVAQLEFLVTWWRTSSTVLLEE